MIFPWLILFDFANFRANFKKPLDFQNVRRRSSDFALLVPIFNDLKHMTNLDFLRQYSQHVILCTTTHESPEFVVDLEQLASENGFRVSYSEIEGAGKNPWAIYYKTLLAHDSVLKRTIDNLDEEYVIFIDGDTYVDGDLTVLCGAMEQYSYDIASVKVLPARRKTVIEHLQGVEYDISMRARLLYPWLTSGAGMVARRVAMVGVMENHSLFFNGGDIEIGKLADMMGYRVGHLPMVFYTDIPASFRAWINQRRSWMCGMFRHSIVNLQLNLWHPFHFLYYTVIIYVLYPFKILEIVNHPQLLPVIIGLYAVATYVANWKVRSKWMLLFPVYALFQVMVVIWLGLARYVDTLIKTRNPGMIRIKNNPIKSSFLRRWDKVGLLTKNFVLVLVAVLVVAVGTVDSLHNIALQQPHRIMGLIEVIDDGLKSLVDWGVPAMYSPSRKAFWLIWPMALTLLLTLLMTRTGTFSARTDLNVNSAITLVNRRHLRRSSTIRRKWHF
jgi:cellulose synthase/poly-beta-1,6-N-acetylglucosamine synthase-like glycosyltransferase